MFESTSKIQGRDGSISTHLALGRPGGDPGDAGEDARVPQRGLRRLAHPVGGNRLTAAGRWRRADRAVDLDGAGDGRPDGGDEAALVIMGQARQGEEEIAVPVVA